MEYDPLLQTVIVDRSLDRIDQIEVGNEIIRLREENAGLKEKLGHKNSRSLNSYDALLEENIKLKRKLGYSDKEIYQSLKKHNPYKKSHKVWVAYMIFAVLSFIAAIIFALIVINYAG